MTERTRRAQITPAGTEAEGSNLKVLLGYGALCLLAWALFILASSDLQRGWIRIFLAAYEATLTLWAPISIGFAVFPWVQWLERRLGEKTWLWLSSHGLAALVFSALWQSFEFGLAWWLFGAEHANALFQQNLLWRLIWGVIVYAAMATGFHAVVNARKAKSAALAQARAESERARAELSALNAKLDPHFLFNTLNSLVALTRIDATKAEAALLQFSSLLRYVLDGRRNDTETVTLEAELAFTRDYLGLESLRLGPRLRVEYQIEDEALSAEVPVLLVQPLVENSIVHGAAKSKRGVTLVIAASLQAEYLHLTISDDGPGFDPSNTHSGRGIGLGSLEQRLKLSCGDRASMEIQSGVSQGFSISLRLPQNESTR